MAWAALIFSLIASMTAGVAAWWAYQAREVALRRVALDPLPAQGGAGVAWPAGPASSGLVASDTWSDVLPDSFVDGEIPGLEAGLRRVIADAVLDGERLSHATRTIIRALSAGREPPVPADYVRVHQAADRFTGSIGRLRAPHHGDLVRDLTDEAVTLHHSLVTEIRQHQNVGYPFVGARDTALAVLVLSKFDAELRRLRRYGQTGEVAIAEEFPVDFDTVRFVPREGHPPDPLH